MALENLVGADKFLNALVVSNPTGGDDKREGDDHLRGLKNTLKNTFPNVNAAVTATPAQLNATADIAGKVNRAGDTMTGPLVATALGAGGIQGLDYGLLQAGSAPFDIPVADSNAPAGRAYATLGNQGVTGAEWLLLRGTYNDINHKSGIMLQDDYLNNGQYGGRYIQATGHRLDFGQLVNGTLGSVNAGLRTDLSLTAGGALVLGFGGIGQMDTGAPDIPGALHVTTDGTSGRQIFMRNNVNSPGIHWQFGVEPGNAVTLYGSNGGGVYIPNQGANWVSTSDERAKTDFVEFTDAAAKVGTLRAGTGRYLGDEPEMSRAFLIAQDVQAVLPQVVHANAQGVLGIAYAEVIPLLVAAIKELTARVAALEALTVP